MQRLGEILPEVLRRLEYAMAERDKKDRGADDAERADMDRMRREDRVP